MLLSMEEFRQFKPMRPTYALLGWPLGHTMSPELHSALFATDATDADYIGVAVPPEALVEALDLAQQKLCGINITIPHKKSIIPLLDEIDADAHALRSVNTVSFVNGKSKGYNTDILGFAASLEKDNIKLCGKKVLLLGYGGAAAVMGHYCVKSGAQLTITGRNFDKAQKLCSYLQSVFPYEKVFACTKKHIPRDIQIVINGTPLGMYPREFSSPLRYLPRKTEYIFDAIYNPPITSTLRLARNHKIKTRDGLYMLVMQAAHAQKIWTKRDFETTELDGILRRLYGKMAVKRLHEKYHKKNIVLCGFMGSGKTTAGRKVARLCGLQFVDADQYLETQENMTITEIFERYGEPHFRQLETQYITELSQTEGIVLALGGGAVLHAENVRAVKQTGLLIHLDTPLYRILKNLSYSTHRPLLTKGNKQTQVRKLYNARKNIYHSVADRSVRSPRLSEVIESIIKAI